LRRSHVAIRHRSLNTEQVLRASELYAEGLSLLRVAEELGVTRGAVNPLCSWGPAPAPAGVELRLSRPKSRL
jgi:hypothetical protein